MKNFIATAFGVPLTIGLVLGCSSDDQRVQSNAGGASAGGSISQGGSAGLNASGAGGGTTGGRTADAGMSTGGDLGVSGTSTVPVAGVSCDDRANGDCACRYSVEPNTTACDDSNSAACCATAGWPAKGASCTCYSLKCQIIGTECGCTLHLAAWTLHSCPAEFNTCCRSGDGRQCNCYSNKTSCGSGESSVPSCDDAELGCPGIQASVTDCQTDSASSGGGSGGVTGVACKEPGWSSASNSLTPNASPNVPPACGQSSDCCENSLCVSGVLNPDTQGFCVARCLKNSDCSTNCCSATSQGDLVCLGPSACQ